MDEERAFEILGLPTSASSQEIEQKFRELASQNHPDSGGTKEELMELIEARETAIDSLPGTELAIYEGESVPAIPNDSFNQKKKQSEKTVNRVIRKQTSAYRRYQQVLKIFGSIIGLITFFRAFITFMSINSPRGSYLLYKLSTIPISTWIFLTAFVGIIYWGLNMKINNIEVIVSEVEEAFDQKSNLLRVLSELDIDLGKDYVTEEELQKAFREWVSEEEGTNPIERQVEIVRSVFSLLSPRLKLRSIAQKIGPADFNRIFLRKCIEAEIIEEHVESAGDGQFEVNYHITL